MRKNKGGASEAKNEDGGDEDLVSVLTLMCHWIELDLFFFSLRHPLTKKRQRKRRPPLPKKSNKKNDPKLFDDQHVEDLISKAPVAAHSMLKVTCPHSFLRRITSAFLEHPESTTGVPRARTRRVRQRHRYRQTRPRQTWTEEVRLVARIRLPSLMRPATRSIRVKCDVVKVRKPVIEARLAPKQAQQIKSVRTESDSSPIKLGSFSASLRLRN